MRKTHSKFVQTLERINVSFETIDKRSVQLNWHGNMYQFWISGVLKGEVISFSHKPRKDYTQFVVAFHPYKNERFAATKVQQFSCLIKAGTIQLEPERW